jgi:hypothetical protein
MHISWRRSLILLIPAVIVATFVVWPLIDFAVHGDPVTRCISPPPGATRNPGKSISTRWEWSPPGYVCVYRNDVGKVVGERRL